MPEQQSTAVENTSKTSPNGVAFPYTGSNARLSRYEKNLKLFEGDHASMFAGMINSARYGQDYDRLKYIVVNFPAMISKITADFLFSEAPGFRVTDKGNQQFIDNLLFENKFHTLCYEQALANSSKGDAVFKIRIDRRNDAATESTIIIEAVDPSIWFPHVNNTNFGADPVAHELAYKLQLGDLTYLRKEIYRPGTITNELWEMKDGSISTQVSWDRAKALFPNQFPDAEVEDTKIARNLIVHIPNWKGPRPSAFGVDDYGDLLSLFYAINNRMTKTENILDKHSDPILALPEGILDEEGKVKKEAFNMFEFNSEGVSNPAKPEYIVWNASLESNFKHIEKLIEFIYLISETSPAVNGQDDSGSASSGKALKLKLLRTLAKVKRKRLYFGPGIQEVLFVAQQLAQAWDISVMGEKPGEPSIVNIDWQDGIPTDTLEAAQEEQTRLDSGTTTKADAIMRLDGISLEDAKKKVTEIDAETKTELPGSNPRIPDAFKSGQGTDPNGARGVDDDVRTNED